MALTDSLVSYWKLDESSGTRADSVGSNNLSENGGTINSAAGIINNAADMVAASSQYLSKTDNASLSITGDMSYQIWVYFDSVPGSSTETYFGAKFVAGGQRSWNLEYETFGSNGIDFNVSSSGATSVGFKHLWTPSTATWYHLVISWEAAAETGSLYINGSLAVAGSTGGVTSIFDSTAPFTINNGAESGTYIDGRFDEAGLWSRTLSSAEVSDLYNGGQGWTYPFMLGNKPENYPRYIKVGANMSRSEIAN